MRKPFMLLLLSLAISGAISGCGEALAPMDAVVTGPQDETVVITGSRGGQRMLFRPIEFNVRNEAGVALSGVKIDLIANNGTIADIDGNQISSITRPDVLETETDERGSVRVALLTDPLPACDAAADLDMTSSMVATVGIASDVVVAKITIKKC